MLNNLVELSELAKERVAEGYYDSQIGMRRRRKSLVQAIRDCKRTPVLSEIKYASPSAGKIRGPEPATGIARDMLAGGACALSILTDPVGFQGGLNVLAEVAKNFQAPLIMKDIIVSPKQVRAAAHYGADALVLISELFSNDLTDVDMTTMIQEARGWGLEVLVEANTVHEFETIQTLKPDLCGINNRNLFTFQVDLSTTTRILAETKPADTPVVSESGIETTADIRRLKTAGAQAFLIGTSIMKSTNIEQKVRELVDS